MNLIEIIKLLKSYPLDKVAELGIGEPCSWRGDYSELAFIEAKNITVGDMLRNAESALGDTFTGWKGGEFTMGEYTECHLVDSQRNLGEPLNTWFFKYHIEKQSKS